VDKTLKRNSTNYLKILKHNAFLIIRLILGLIFIFSGYEKLQSPYQNFLYVIENYDFLIPFLEMFTAKVMPWLELIAGVFLVLGLWTRQSLRMITLLLLGFILVVGQAMVRKLPITDCGCFGESLSFPLHIVILFDSTLLALTLAHIYFQNPFQLLGLDKYFSDSEKK